MPLAFGLNGILAAFPLADFLAAIVTIIWLLTEIKKLKLIPVYSPELP